MCDYWEVMASLSYRKHHAVSYYGSKNAKRVPGVADANKHLKELHV